MPQYRRLQALYCASRVYSVCYNAIAIKLDIIPVHNISDVHVGSEFDFNEDRDKLGTVWLIDEETDILSKRVRLFVCQITTRQTRRIQR